ncbi:MAG TPA: helix-turn-helix domain-containing protein, partial [Acidimicrobiales bacterium]|nr:helix-turn-helix domain-containing protein [Acidimicrobiales bacterium]
MQTEIDRRAAVHAALGEPLRLAIIDELSSSDRAPSDLAARFGLAGNLLAHHLHVLERVGLIERVVSAGDRRRRYVRLRHRGVSDM